MYQKSEYSKNRRAILVSLFKQPMDFTELRDQTKLSEPTLSKHLRDLLNSKFIEVKYKGRRKIYNITEKAIDSELKMYMVGIFSAYNVFSSKDFWKAAGMETAKMMSAGHDSLLTFVQAIARHSPIEFADERGGKEIFDNIISDMIKNYTTLERLRDNIEEVELRGGDLEPLKKKFREKLDSFTSMYYALGPPFSYMWKNMCEGCEGFE